MSTLIHLLRVLLKVLLIVFLIVFEKLEIIVSLLEFSVKFLFTCVLEEKDLKL